ncbi:MAG: pyridoxal-phosphate dependent enzyme [Bacteroidia bacterium]|nr:pyridoxal-phosphate dependent enzyme [Bacteroidia bacterium]MDW8333525.1 pyridoxal-phosphate dependent enzyme [Bacteroidia bacterium]
MTNWIGPYPSSRIQRIEITRRINVDFFLKRDDELGWAGSKTRKYLTLVPFLSRFDVAVVVGSFYSANVPALSAALLQAGVEPVAFLRGTGPWVGNALLTRLFLPLERIYCVPKSENLIERAFEYAEKRREEGKRVFVVPEGAKTPASIAGAASLALDLPDCRFLFLESGSGTTAASVILALKYLRSTIKTFVALMAGSPAEFSRTLAEFHVHFVNRLGEAFDLPLEGDDYVTLVSPTKFGRVADDDLKRSIYWSRRAGIIADPVYTAKFLDMTSAAIETYRLHGQVTAVLSGASGTLFGYAERLSAFC